MDVQGAEQLARLSSTLKGLAGANGIQKDFNKALTKAVQPLRQTVKQSARTTLPRRGGLAADIARSRISRRTSDSRKGAGLRVFVKGPYDLDAIDKGIVHHPKGPDQRIAPGWWTRPTEATGPDVRKAVETAMDDAAKKIDRAV
jgi:hypothetical protein